MSRRASRRTGSVDLVKIMPWPLRDDARGPGAQNYSGMGQVKKILGTGIRRPQEILGAGIRQARWIIAPQRPQ